MLAGDTFPGPPSVIVDIGCGHGRAARAIGATGRRVVLVDRSIDLVEESRFAPGVVGGCVADATHLPFREAGVEGALAMEILEHLPAPHLVVAEMSRVVKSGGGVLVTVPNGWLERVYRRLNPDYWATTTHEQIFTRHRLRSLMNGHGLIVVSLRSVSFEWAVRWLAHAVLRSEFDATGEIHSHQRVQRWMDRGFRLIERPRLGGRVLVATGRLMGKSLSVEARKP